MSRSDCLSHLQAGSLRVKVGDCVRKGQLLAKLGSGGPRIKVSTVTGFIVLQRL